jgi:hypothetical protein
MKRPIEPEAVQVACHSGYTYAQEPRSLIWQGQEYEVTKVEVRWRTPEGPAFRVRTQSGERFDLLYQESEDEWVLGTLPDADPGAAKGAGILPLP